MAEANANKKTELDEHDVKIIHHAIDLLMKSLERAARALELSGRAETAKATRAELAQVVKIKGKIA